MRNSWECSSQGRARGTGPRSRPAPRPGDTGPHAWVGRARAWEVGALRLRRVLVSGVHLASRERRGDRQETRAVAWLRVHALSSARRAADTGPLGPVLEPVPGARRPPHLLSAPPRNPGRGRRTCRRPGPRALVGERASPCHAGKTARPFGGGGQLSLAGPGPRSADLGSRHRKAASGFSSHFMGP